MYHKVIILGAGPAGLQAGYFLGKLGVDYLIIERNEIAASFFSNFPISKKLISLNKVHTGTDNKNVNLRYDWNSLLNDEDMLFKHYSEDFYPNTDQLQTYLNTFASSLNVMYGCNVTCVNKNEKFYSLITYEGEYTCDKLIVATGMVPVKTIHPHYGTLGRVYFEDKEKFKGKTVLIVGSGNSAFELANMLTPYAATILLFGRSLKLAANTHYAGHLRTSALDFVDTGMLKLQNFMYIDSKEKDYEDSDFVYENGKYHYTFKKGPLSMQSFDYLFMCTGFEFDDSIFNFKVDRTTTSTSSSSPSSDNTSSGENEERGKFPSVNEVYESTNNSNLYFVGNLMHGLDFGRSPGGFIHGFRYSIKYMIEQNFSTKITTRIKSFRMLVDHIFDRLTSESGLIVMFDQFCDYFYFVNGEYTYVPFVNKQWVLKNAIDDGNNGFTVSYNFGSQKFDAFKERRGRVTQSAEHGAEQHEGKEEEEPAFIHPVITDLKDGKKYHCYEDDVLNFTKLIHKVKLRETLKEALHID